MKTEAIDIYEITKLTNGFEIEYDLEGNDVTLLVSNSEIITFIIDNELNMFERFSEELGELDQWYANPQTVLNDDYYSIVSQYLNDLHK